MMKNKLTNNCASFIKSGLLAAILLAISFYSVAYAASGTGVDPSLTVLSARSLALGQAGAALSDDGDAIFNNPAGLAYAKFPKLSVSQKKLLLDEADLSSLGFAVPTDWGVFGIAGMDTSTGGSLPTMRDATNNRITVNPSTAAYSYDNNVVFLSYSRKYDQYLSFGGNYKIFNQPSHDKS